MICLDLDGTLLRSDKSIDINTANILNRLSDIGIQIVIATGRHYDFAKLLTNGLTNDRLIIANNGAAIFDVYNEKSIYTKYLSNEISTEIVNMGLEFELDALVYVNAMEESSDLLVFDHDGIDKFENTIVRDLNRIKHIKSTSEIDSVLSVVFSDYYNTLEKLKAKILQEYNGSINTHIMTSGVSEHGILEVMDESVCKWSAISVLSDILNIDTNEIIAFGDEVNDITMLNNAGIGIAMKNGQLKAKQEADYVSEYSNDDDGIYYELKKLFPLLEEK